MGNADSEMEQLFEQKKRLKNPLVPIGNSNCFSFSYRFFFVFILILFFFNAILVRFVLDDAFPFLIMLGFLKLLFLFVCCCVELVFGKWLMVFVPAEKD